MTVHLDRNPFHHESFMYSGFEVACVGIYIDIMWIVVIEHRFKKNDVGIVTWLQSELFLEQNFVVLLDETSWNLLKLKQMRRNIHWRK